MRTEYGTSRECVRKRERERWLRRSYYAVLMLLLLMTGVFVIRQAITQGRTAPPDDLERRAQELTDREKLDFIRDNPSLYPERLRELAEKNGEALDYVYLYPVRKDSVPEIDLSVEAAAGTGTLLLQWDERWGYRSYGDGLMGYTGCGPTSLSMVALWLTGDGRYTPAYIAAQADKDGYYVNEKGSSWSLMSEGCAEFGLSSQEVQLDELKMAAQLQEGHPLICAMGPGDFTDSGHFLVLCGYENGAFSLLDPNSPARSARTWTFEELKGQIRNIWSFSSI